MPRKIPNKALKDKTEPEEPTKPSTRIVFDKEYYTVQQVADYLGFTEKTVRNWNERGLIDFIDIGGSKRIPVKEVLRLSGKSTDLIA